MNKSLSSDEIRL